MRLIGYMVLFIGAYMLPGAVQLMLNAEDGKAPKEANPPIEVAKLVKDSNVATVATIYEKKMPFGSLMPYAIDDKGNLIVLISTLAVHTDNIDAHKESSFTISKIDKDNVFNSARVCLMGDTTQVPDNEAEAVKKLFIKRFPKAAFWADFEDFAFYRIDVKEIFYVGGFGNIHWVDLEDYRKAMK